MSHINYEAKSDREIILLTAQTVNTISEEQLPEIVERTKDNQARSYNNQAAIDGIKLRCGVNGEQLTIGNKIKLAAETKSGIIALVCLVVVELIKEFP